MSGYDSDEVTALSKLGADEQVKADLPLVQQGTGIPEPPNRRIMTGAVDSTQAAEQATLLAGADLTKTVSESGNKVSS